MNVKEKLRTALSRLLNARIERAGCADCLIKAEKEVAQSKDQLIQVIKAIGRPQVLHNGRIFELTPDGEELKETTVKMVVLTSGDGEEQGERSEE